MSISISVSRTCCVGFMRLCAFLCSGVLGSASVTDVSSESFILPGQSGAKMFAQRVVDLLRTVTDRDDSLLPRPSVVEGDEQPDRCPLGRLELGDEIARSFRSRTYAADAVHARTGVHSPVRVRYHTDCIDLMLPSRKQVGGTMLEYAILGALEPLEIAPRMLYLSPEVDIPDHPSQPVKSLAVEEEVCAGSRVRFSVSEPTGPSARQLLATYAPSMSPRELAQVIVTIGLQTLSHLEQLHNLGLTHGNINSDSIVARKLTVDTVEELKLAEYFLIDFELARFTEIDKLEDPGVGFSETRPRDRSLWEMEGFRSGKRDDVYRLLETMARLFSNGTWETGFEMLVAETFIGGQLGIGAEIVSMSEAEELVALSVKTTASNFIYSPVLHSEACPGLPRDIKKALQRIMEELMNHLVSAYEDPDEDVEYEFFRTGLSTIHSFLEY